MVGAARDELKQLEPGPRCPVAQLPSCPAMLPRDSGGHPDSRPCPLANISAVRNGPVGASTRSPSLPVLNIGGENNSVVDVFLASQSGGCVIRGAASFYWKGKRSASINIRPLGALPSITPSAQPLPPASTRRSKAICFVTPSATSSTLSLIISGRSKYLDPVRCYQVQAWHCLASSLLLLAAIGPGPRTGSGYRLRTDPPHFTLSPPDEKDRRLISPPNYFSFALQSSCQLHFTSSSFFFFSPANFRVPIVPLSRNMLHPPRLFHPNRQECCTQQPHTRQPIQRGWRARPSNPTLVNAPRPPGFATRGIRLQTMQDGILTLSASGRCSRDAAQERSWSARKGPRRPCAYKALLLTAAVTICRHSSRHAHQRRRIIVVQLSTSLQETNRPLHPRPAGTRLTLPRGNDAS